MVLIYFALLKSHNSDVPRVFCLLIYLDRDIMSTNIIKKAGKGMVNTL